MEYDILVFSRNGSMLITHMNALKIELKAELEQFNKKYPSEVGIYAIESCNWFYIYTKRDITMLILNKIEGELEEFNITYPLQACIPYAICNIYKAKCSLYSLNLTMFASYRIALDIILKLREHIISDCAYDYEKATKVLNDLKIKYKLYHKVGFIYDFKIELESEKTYD